MDRNGDARAQAGIFQHASQLLIVTATLSRPALVNPGLDFAPLLID